MGQNLSFLGIMHPVEADVSYFLYGGFEKSREKSLPDCETCSLMIPFKGTG
jgi:hypothetical protein